MYPETLFNVVLVEPEIPQNTGTTGRSCVGYWSHLHLVGKLGFEISDRQLKRAGLDYWQNLMWTHHPKWEDWVSQVSDFSRVFFFSTKAKRALYQAEFKKGDWLVFGSETRGLGAAILKKYESQTLTLPFPGPVRSFNLSNSVAMALSEGYRQLLSAPRGANC